MDEENKYRSEKVYFSATIFKELKKLYDEILLKTEDFLIENGAPLKKESNKFNRAICRLFLLKIMKTFEYDGKKRIECSYCKNVKEIDLTRAIAGEKVDSICEKCGTRCYFAILDTKY